MENIDLEDALNAGAYHSEGTAKSYSSFLNKFAVFVGDGKFFHYLGQSNNYKPHFKKSGLAAINLGVQHHHLENIYAFKHLYPNLHLILKQWECHLKAHPYFVTKGERFDTSAVSMILAMSSSTDIEIRDQAATVAIIFTGLRADSLYLAETSNWTRMMIQLDLHKTRILILIVINYHLV